MKGLSPGDTIEIVAPSARGSDVELEAAQDFIESWGFKEKVDDDLYGEDIFYANSNFERATLFKKALLSEDNNAIWPIRGGKGATEIIPYLEGKIESFEGLPDILPKEKLLLGFSDITALHIFLTQKYGWETLHSPVLFQMVEKHLDEESRNLLKDIILKDEAKIKNIDYDLELLVEFCPMKITAKIVGGNLTLIEKSIGTDWEIETDNKILFLEDVNGEAYELERSLTHLIESHKLDNVAAVILGDFVKIKKEELISEVEERFVEKFKEYQHLNSSTPIFKTNKIGHGDTNYPLPLNTEVKITELDNEYVILFNDIL